jgi:hypothetical protein
MAGITRWDPLGRQSSNNGEQLQTARGAKGQKSDNQTSVQRTGAQPAMSQASAGQPMNMMEGRESSS